MFEREESECAKTNLTVSAVERVVFGRRALRRETGVAVEEAAAPCAFFSSAAASSVGSSSSGRTISSNSLLPGNSPSGSCVFMADETLSVRPSIPTGCVRPDPGWILPGAPCNGLLDDEGDVFIAGLLAPNPQSRWMTGRFLIPPRSPVF